MADKEKEKELSPFDRWEEQAAKEAEQQQKFEELIQADPANLTDFKDQAINEGKMLNSAGVEQGELTPLEESGYVDFDKSPSHMPNQVPNYGEKWEPQIAEPAPKQDLDATLAEVGQALNQAGVETQEQSPFDQWEAQKPEAPKQTQLEPQQEQNQEPER